MNEKNLWEKIGAAPNEAKLVRNVLEYRDILLDIGKWTPFPQNCCCYLFAEKEQPDLAYPLPLGILIYLWENWENCRGKCPECGGMIYGFGFGGLLSRGGVIGCCIQCGIEVFRQLGGLGIVGNEVQRILEPSTYKVKTGLLGGACVGPRAPLVNLLKQLGAKDVPDDNWVEAKSSSRVSLSITL